MNKLKGIFCHGPKKFNFLNYGHKDDFHKAEIVLLYIELVKKCLELFIKKNFINKFIQ